MGGLLLAVGNGDNTFNSTVTDVLKIVNDYVIRGLIIVGTVVLAVMFLINWIKYGKAEDGEPKTKAKKAIIGTGIACVGLFASIWLLPMLIDFLITVFKPEPIVDPTGALPFLIV